MSQNQSRKPTPAQQRAEEALDQIAKSSSQPTKKVLDFLLAGSHDNPLPVPDPNQTQPKPDPILLNSPAVNNRTPHVTDTLSVTQTVIRQPSQTNPNPGPDPDQSSTKTNPDDRVNASIAPSRDFNRRANSIDREALPAGVFPGASKKLYDCLYLRTRGAIQPTRTIQATRRELIRWSGVKNIKTINAHIRNLSICGLIKHVKCNGDHEGSVYEIFLPEEVGPDQTQTTPKPDPIQKTVLDQDRFLDWVGSGKAHDNKSTSGSSKTSLKTNTKNDDDDAFIELVELLRSAASDLTGKVPAPHEKQRWREVAEVIVGELKTASLKATTVSSVPAFLAEHLRRRLHQSSQREQQGSDKPKRQSSSPRPPPPPPAPSEPQEIRKLTEEEITDMAAMLKDLMAQKGYGIEHAEAQFKASLHPDDWQVLLSTMNFETTPKR